MPEHFTQKYLLYADHAEEIRYHSEVLAQIQAGGTHPELKATADSLIARIDALQTAQKARLVDQLPEGFPK